VFLFVLCVEEGDAHFVVSASTLVSPFCACGQLSLSIHGGLETRQDRLLRSNITLVRLLPTVVAGPRCIMSFL